MANRKGKTSAARTGQPRSGDRATARDLSRAGSRSTGSSELGPILGWTVAFIVVAAVVIGAAFLVSQPSGGGSGGINAPTVVTPPNIPSDGRTLGRANAPVTVDIYGDFRCSACLFFTTDGPEQALVSDYIATGKARLVWHDRLIIDENLGGHTSRDAANAAWCGADQGKFWTMHDWLYANSAETSTAFTAARLSQIGNSAGLDMTRYQQCLDAGTHVAQITAENAAETATINATPTLVVNGTAVGDSSYASLKAAIDAALARPAPTPAPSPSAS